MKYLQTYSKSLHAGESVFQEIAALQPDWRYPLDAPAARSCATWLAKRNGTWRLYSMGVPYRPKSSGILSAPVCYDFILRREIASVEKVTRDAIVVVAREVVEESGAYIDIFSDGRRIPKNRVGAPNSVCGIGFDCKEAVNALFDGVRARLAEYDKKAQRLRGVLSLPVREEDNIE